MTTTDPHVSDLGLPTAAGFITRDQARERGYDDSTIDQRLRTGGWRRIHPAVYATDHRLVTSEPHLWSRDERLAAARLDAGQDAIVYGASAADHWGLQGLWRKDEAIELALPRGREHHQRPGYFLHTVDIWPEDIVESHGMLVTSPLRTVVDLALRLPRFRSVSIIDSALNRGLIHVDDRSGFVARTYRRRGALSARRDWDDADGRSESPVETCIRLVLVDARIPPDDLQVPIHDAQGVLLGRGDLGYDLRKHNPRSPFRWGIIEADGVDVHSAPDALFRDRRRANDFTTYGDATIVRFTGADLRRPAYIVTVARGLLAS